MCVYYLAGKCIKGECCGFAHSPYELTNPKQVLCPAAATVQGCLLHPSSCPLAHSPDEIVPSRPTQLQLKSSKVCRYFASGKCLAGEFCRHAHFAHEFTRIQQPLLLFPALSEPVDGEDLLFSLEELVSMLTTTLAAPSSCSTSSALKYVLLSLIYRDAIERETY